MPMPKQAGDYRYSRGYYGYQRPYPQPYTQVITPVRPQLRPVRKKKVLRRKRVNPFARLISWAILALLAIYVLPYGYDRISKPLLFGPPYKEVKVDYNELYSPTVNYLSNDLFLNTRLLTEAKIKKPEMTTLYTTEKMPVVEAKLTKLMAMYKTIDPSIFVWDYDTGKYVDIKASEPYAAASIIKIPVLIQLFKSIEANQLTIYDEMALTPYYKAEGSGDLQTRALGAKYTIDELARAMITKSDNSATNMIVSTIGGMPDVNGGIRSWGLKNTYINNWLPDIDGTNYTTAKDLATMLYNLDNPGFLNINSREYIVDYMSHVENNRLIQAGLDPKALFVHKTGDIGKMLGDAGIVFTPSGKKYIVAILANRPYNSQLGKDFIQKASSIIYNSITSKVY
ncbi:MAG: serine hydrolase [Candidatus Gastranaerophilaceae bacterium]